MDHYTGVAAHSSNIKRDNKNSYSNPILLLNKI